MKRLSLLFSLVLVFALTFAGMQDRSSHVQLVPDPGNYIKMPEVTAPATPATGWGSVYTSGNNIYFLDDAGVTTSLIGAASGGATNLDEAYDGGGAGAGATISADSGPVIVAGSGADIGLQVTHSGAGNSIDIINSGTGKDIDGTSSTWSVTKEGLGTFASLGAFTGVGNIILDDGVTASPSFTFTDATDETAVFSKADAGVLGLTTDATDGLNILVGNLWVGNGSPGTASMNGEDAYVEGQFEVDGTVQLDGAVTMASTVAITGVVTLANGLTIDNAVNNSFEWNENSEEIKWVFGSNDLGLVSTSGVVELSFFDNAASAKLTHAADGAADDFYIQQTGAQDASLFITSAGTGADALSLSATAGGIDIDTALGDMTINANAAGKNISVGSVLGSIYIEAEEDTANAIHIIADGGTSSGLILLNDTGTGDESILLDSDAGGITINTNAGSVDIEAVGATDGDIGISAGDDMTLTAAGDLTFAVTGTMDFGGSAIVSAISDAEAVTATNVITAAESGKIFFLNNSTTEFVTTLPAISAVSAGWNCKFYVTAAPSGDNYTITTGNSLENVLIGGMVEREVDTSDDGPYAVNFDTIVVVDGVAAVGDMFEIVSDGSKYYVTGVSNADGGYTLITAD